MSDKSAPFLRNLRSVIDIPILLAIGKDSSNSLDAVKCPRLRLQVKPRPAITDYKRPLQPNRSEGVELLKREQNSLRTIAMTLISRI